MREIKFRAWDTQYNKWAYFTLGHLISGDVTDIAQRCKNWCESTSLKDKNGVEIFEGDVLLHLDKHYVVKWDNYMAAFQSENVQDKIDADFFNWGNVPSLQTQGVPNFTGGRFEGNCDVIGNIYENPELLKEAA